MEFGGWEQDRNCEEPIVSGGLVSAEVVRRDSLKVTELTEVAPETKITWSQVSSSSHSRRQLSKTIELVKSKLSRPRSTWLGISKMNINNEMQRTNVAQRDQVANSSL